MGEELKEELKMRLSTPQYQALMRIAEREGIKPSSLARSVLHKYLTNEDAGFFRTMETPTDEPTPAMKRASKAGGKYPKKSLKRASAG